jgi:uncharacterized protein
LYPYGKAGGIQRQGATGEAVALYCDPLVTTDLDFSGFCNVGVNTVNFGWYFIRLDYVYIEGAFMRTWISVLIIFVAGFSQASDHQRSSMTTETLCSDSWYRLIEETVTTSDNQGHGPDVGSGEWKSVIEFKLGIRDKPNLPDHDSDAWCRHIDQTIREKYAALSEPNENLSESVMAVGPSYDCDKVKTNSIEEMICKDHDLSALDRKLSMIYSAAAKKATNQHPLVLKAEQRGWIKGRNDCWNRDDKRACVQDECQRRIAELQARYRLVKGNGPFRFICGENPANEVIVTFFQTDPPTLIAERGDSVSLMYLRPSGSGTKYQGRNETYWEHQGEASITWGYGASQMRCKKAP